VVVVFFSVPSATAESESESDPAKSWGVLCVFPKRNHRFHVK